MAAYYNEIDKFSAQWLRELIKSGLIADGEVDERSIEDVIPSELVGFTQCHLFAGIGGWSYALRLAGWPDDKPVWTGSCPCQPFSAAGKGGGTSDERHLWPSFEWLIRVCRPNVIFGEQVESAIKHYWLDHVALSLEGIGYAVGAVGFPACSVGAPHIRQRLYWVAQSDGDRSGSRWAKREGQQRASSSFVGSPARRVADADSTEQQTRLSIGSAEGQGNSGCGGNAGVLGDSESTGLQEQRRDGRVSRGQVGAVQGQASKRTGAPTNGFWRNAEWLPCRDGKARPVEPGTFPLAHGVPARVGRLRGYGNAIVAMQAAAFIRAMMETI